MATLNIEDLPDRIYRPLKERADRNGHTVEQEVICILEEMLGAQEKTHSILELEGLGKELWEKALGGKDPAEYISEERDSWHNAD